MTGKKKLTLIPMTRMIDNIWRTLIHARHPASKPVRELAMMARFGLLLGLFLMASCRDANLVGSGNTQDSMRSEKLNRIESETGLVLPAKSKLIHFLEPERFVDPVWVAKIVMSKSSYQGFKEAVLEKVTDRTIYDGVLANSTSWWKPTHVVLTKQYLANRQTFVVVVVSKEGEEFAVYIECAVF